MAHEIALKGFPVEGDETTPFAFDLKMEYKDIIGLVARSHSMNVRDTMEYVMEKFPDDPHFPYEIEVPFLMCILRVADYFQFDSSRTNAFLIKLRSFTSLFSATEHAAHLATEYFKTDERDPETLFVDLKPKDGLMYTKLVTLFDNIQKELDTSFAILGEMYGHKREHLKLRYRRIRTNLKNKKVIGKLPYVAGAFRFEADTDLFKLLVGPLYGYDPSFGVRELIQNSVDACIEMGHKCDKTYAPLIEININKLGEQYSFAITDNGKGMSLGEIKNYFLKAGASFRNSTEWKINHLTEENTPAIRRTGKFGIGVLASFLIGDTIEVTTKRKDEKIGYTFKADLNSEFIEIRKNEICEIGTTIKIQMTKENYEAFASHNEVLTQWFILSWPKINYFIDGKQVLLDPANVIELKNDKQSMYDAITLNFENFDDIIWKYLPPRAYDPNNKAKSKGIAINGIVIPSQYRPSIEYNTSGQQKKTIYDEINQFPFVSILDRNNLIDLELSRNAIRGHLPFIKELVESCKLDFLYKLIFFNVPIANNILDLDDYREFGYSSYEYKLSLGTHQFRTNDIYTTTEGYFLNNSFYTPILKGLNCFKIFRQNYENRKIELLDKSINTLTHFSGANGERNILRGDYSDYLAISKPDIYWENYESKSITKGVRENIILLEENDDYVIFSHGGYTIKHKDVLLDVYGKNNAEAVQLIKKSLSSDPILTELLKKHILKPTLIPHDFEEKKKYAKTLSKELQQHVEEKRGIKL